jgi:hypothetical protein
MKLESHKWDDYWRNEEACFVMVLVMQHNELRLCIWMFDVENSMYGEKCVDMFISSVSQRIVCDSKWRAVILHSH